MSKLALLAVSLLSLTTFGQRVAYEGWVDDKINGVRTMANVANDKVNQLNRVVIGDDFAIVVTNYDSKTRMPTAKFRFKLEDGSWREVWNELTRWSWFFSTWVPTNLYTKAQCDTNFARKAWGQYTSGLGEESPDGNLWVTQPVVVSSGLEWVPFKLESSGSIWVLMANGLAPGGSAADGTGSFLKITDDTGKEVFKIVRGDKELKGALIDDFRMTSHPSGAILIELAFSVESSKPPDVEYATSLDVKPVEWTDVPDEWYDKSVTGTSGAWRRAFNVPATSLARFFRGKYEHGNDPYIENSAPVSVSGGFRTVDKATGKPVKVNLVVNNGVVSWEVAAQ